jgi:serine/threonine-protein kinase RsbT
MVAAACMKVEKSESMDLRSGEDVVRVRQIVRAHAVNAGFSLVDQTKIITAASEIGRNTLVHGGGGKMIMEYVREGSRRGVRLTFSDQGPGIPDVTQAMKDGFTTGNGMGLGLSGAKRLSTEFSIESGPGMGTTVTLARWR